MDVAAASLLAATAGRGGSAGLLVVLLVVGVLGWVVARSLQRQRDYERRLHEHPDGLHGGRPADDPDTTDDPAG